MGYEQFLPIHIFMIAIFNWDTDTSSKKLSVEDDQLTIKVKDGSGFKTSIGDQVGTQPLSTKDFSQP